MTATRASQPQTSAERSRVSPPPADARGKVLDAAGRLFYLEGIRATGVEAVVQAAGVAKISLYRAFDTKDDLVIAYLQRRRAEYWQRWDDLVAQHDDPQGQLLAVIDHLAERITTPGYRGCPFMNCAVEFPDPASPQRALAIAVKAEVRQRLTSMCAPLSDRPARLADALFLLIEGAYAACHTSGGPDGPAAALPSIARALIAAEQSPAGDGTTA
jgi:AcrR family transcriptional regulator